MDASGSSLRLAQRLQEYYTASFSIFFCCNYVFRHCLPRDMVGVDYPVCAAIYISYPHYHPLLHYLAYTSNTVADDSLSTILQCPVLPCNGLQRIPPSSQRRVRVQAETIVTSSETLGAVQPFQRLPHRTTVGDQRRRLETLETGRKIRSEEAGQGLHRHLCPRLMPQMRLIPSLAPSDRDATIAARNSSSDPTRLHDA